MLLFTMLLFASGLGAVNGAVLSPNFTSPDLQLLPSDSVSEPSHQTHMMIRSDDLPVDHSNCREVYGHGLDHDHTDPPQSAFHQHSNCYAGLEKEAMDKNKRLVGGLAGGLGALALLASLLSCCLCFSRRRGRKDTQTVTQVVEKPLDVEQTAGQGVPVAAATSTAPRTQTGTGTTQPATQSVTSNPTTNTQSLDGTTVVPSSTTANTVPNAAGGATQPQATAVTNTVPA